MELYVDVAFFSFVLNSPYSVHRAHAGESERFLREAFSEAHSHAASGKPSVVFIDEIDSICPRRNDKYVSEVMAHYFIYIFSRKKLPAIYSVCGDFCGL